MPLVVTNKTSKILFNITPAPTLKVAGLKTTLPKYVPREYNSRKGNTNSINILSGFFSSFEIRINSLLGSVNIFLQRVKKKSIFLWYLFNHKNKLFLQ